MTWPLFAAKLQRKVGERRAFEQQCAGNAKLGLKHDRLLDGSWVAFVSSRDRIRRALRIMRRSLDTSSIDPETIARIQEGFLEALPRIMRVARFRLRFLTGERMEEAIAETVALSWQAYRRLF